MEPPVDIESDDEGLNLWLLLVQARDAVHNARHKELSKHNISLGQASMLFAISYLGDDVVPARLSPLVFRKPNTVSDIIKRMEKEGLVSTKKDTKRKNVIRVSLTKKGKQLFKLALKRESIHGIMGSLSPAEKKQLKSGLKKLRDNAFREMERW